MAIEVSADAVLYSSTVAPEDPIDGSDFKNLEKRANAQEELIKDTAAQGVVAAAGAQTEDGHIHNGIDGRSIARGVSGGFALVPQGVTFSYDMSQYNGMPASIANGPEAGAYTGSYPVAASPNRRNYQMGKVYVSPAIKELRVEISAKVESIENSPQIRVKNLTDSALPGNENIWASEWITLTDTIIKWYGSDETTEKIKVPVLPTTDGSAKEVFLDIEVRCGNSDGSASIQFDIFEATPYEIVDQPL